MPDPTLPAPELPAQHPRGELAWPTPPSSGVPPARPVRHTGRHYRRPLLALPAMIAFGLVAAFFAAQAAEPLWLAFGRGVEGTATVTRCDALDRRPVTGEPAATEPAATRPGTPERPTYPCVVFASSAFQVADVDLRAAGDVHRREGASTPARMLSASHTRAYADHPAGLHLRWAVGFALVLACGAGVAWVSGATRLESRRARRNAVALSVAGPVLLAAGFLGATY